MLFGSGCLVKEETKTEVLKSASVHGLWSSVTTPFFMYMHKKIPQTLPNYTRIRRGLFQQQNRQNTLIVEARSLHLGHSWTPLYTGVSIRPLHVTALVTLQKRLYAPLLPTLPSFLQTALHWLHGLASSSKMCSGVCARMFTPPFFRKQNGPRTTGKEQSVPRKVTGWTIT